MIPHRMCKAHNFNLIYNQNREFIFEIQMVGCFQTLQVDHSQASVIPYFENATLKTASILITNKLKWT